MPALIVWGLFYLTYPDGTEKAIQYASCTLTNIHKKKYAQIDKEIYSQED